MLRQILASALCFAGVMATFAFWYEIIPLQPKFLEWQRDPYNVWLTLGAWGLLGGISCFFFSHHIAGWAMKVNLLPTDTRDPEEQRVLQALECAAKHLKLRHRPQLGVYEREEVNAFTVGFTVRRSILALSRGALRSLSDDNLEILISRELLHLSSGDVKALAFMQGVIFAFTLYVARMLAFLLGTSLRQTEEEETSSHGVEILLTGILILLLTFPGALLFWLFSRSSALRADATVSRVYSREAYRSFLSQVQGHMPPRAEIFSDAFKLQSRTYPAWLSLQPNLALRTRLLSAQ